jgi:short-subunit dehydrogenase
MIIIITGASKGLGKAFANIFAQPNNIILLCARNKEHLQQTSNELAVNYPSTKFYYQSVDMSSKEAVQQFADWCLQFGVPDILINNAGQFVSASIIEEDIEMMEKMMNTNFYSAYYLTKALMPAMIKKKSGHIFNVCSIASLQAYSTGASYSISKFALFGFSKNLREALKPYGIKVTAIMPGAVYTNSWRNTDIDEKRVMQVNDIATMVHAAAQLSPQACVEDIIIRPQLGDL